MKLLFALSGVLAAVLVLTPGMLRGTGQADAAGPNLIVNGSFDSGISGWYNDASYLDVSWSSDDALGSGTSGSVEVSNLNPYEYTNSAYFAQCVQVEPGGTYEVSGWIRVPAGQPRFQHAGIWPISYTNNDCTGTETGWPMVLGTSADWTFGSNSITFSGSTQSVKIILTVGKLAPGQGDDPADPVTAFFDEVVFALQDEAPSPTATATLPPDTATPTATVPGPTATTAAATATATGVAATATPGPPATGGGMASGSDGSTPGILFAGAGLLLASGAFVVLRRRSMAR